jgi:hypothetical protein
MAPPFQVGIFMARTAADSAKQPGPARPPAGVGQGPRAGRVDAVPGVADLADDLPSGGYFVSASPTSQAVGGDHGAQRSGRAPKKIQVSRSLGKLSSASATLSQGDAAIATSVFGVARPFDVDGCDAVGTVALTGSFRITAQIGGAATAMASLTGTLNDQPVQYEFMFNTLTIADDNSVTGSFDITSISGAFSGNGTGLLTGSLVDRALSGGISGVVNTSTPRICNFIGTLRAAGDTSFILGLEQRAHGGVFTDAATPAVALPVGVDEYLAAFTVLFDGDVPPPAAVTFTGPAGSGLSNTPASGRRSEFDADGSGATYVSPLIARAGGGPDGDYSLLYKGAPRVLTVPEPATDRRLVLAVPTIDVDPTGVLTAVSLTWKDRTGAAIDPPAFVGRVQVSLESNAGLSPLYLSPPMPRGNTSHTLALPVLWEDAAELALLYQDTVTGASTAWPIPRPAARSWSWPRAHGRQDNHRQPVPDPVVRGAHRLVDIDTAGAVLADGEPCPLRPHGGGRSARRRFHPTQRDRRRPIGHPGGLHGRRSPAGARVRRPACNPSTNRRSVHESHRRSRPTRCWGCGGRSVDAAARGGRRLDIDAVELSGSVRAPTAVCVQRMPIASWGPTRPRLHHAADDVHPGQPVDSAQVCLLVAHPRRGDEGLSQLRSRRHDRGSRRRVCD